MGVKIFFKKYLLCTNSIKPLWLSAFKKKFIGEGLVISDELLFFLCNAITFTYRPLEPLNPLKPLFLTSINSNFYIDLASTIGLCFEDFHLSNFLNKSYMICRRHRYNQTVNGLGIFSVTIW